MTSKPSLSQKTLRPWRNWRHQQSGNTTAGRVKWSTTTLNHPSSILENIDFININPSASHEEITNMSEIHKTCFSSVNFALLLTVWIQTKVDCTYNLHCDPFELFEYLKLCIRHVQGRMACLVLEVTVLISIWQIACTVLTLLLHLNVLVRVFLFHYAMHSKRLCSKTFIWSINKIGLFNKCANV